MVFNKEGNLRHHSRTVHGKSKKMFQCPYCSYVSSRRDNTNCHLKRLDFATPIAVDASTKQPARVGIHKTIHNPTDSMKPINAHLSQGKPSFQIRPGNATNSP